MVYRRNSKTGNKKYTAPRWRKPAVAALIVAIVAVAVIGVWAIAHKSQPPAITASSNTKGEVGTQTSGTPSSNSSKTDQGGGTYSSDNKTPENNTPAAPGEKPLTPTGNFVSAHRNIPSNATLASSCVTTAGATCQIVFTKDGVTKTLPAQTTDAGGGTYWQSWKPSDIGLTAGSWHVQAKAVLGSQVVTADDELTLDIAS